MKISEIDKSLHSVMVGSVSIKTKAIKRVSRYSIDKYKTESITQAKDYGKLE